MNIWGIFFCCMCVVLFNATLLLLAIAEKNEDEKEHRRVRRNARHGMPSVRGDGVLF